jgi:hypothetical protein
VIYGAINFQLIPQPDCRRFAPASQLGARMTKKGKPLVFMPKTNGLLNPSDFTLSNKFIFDSKSRFESHLLYYSRFTA